MHTETIDVDVEDNLKCPKYVHKKAPKNLPDLHFLMALFASRGGGKTTALVKMIRAYIRNQSFHHIVIFCPTVNLDQKYKDLVFPLCITEHDKLPHKIGKKPILHVYEQPTKENISNIIEYIREEQEEYAKFLKAREKWQRILKKGVDSMSDEELLLYEYEGEPKSMYDSRVSALMLFDDCVGNRAVYSNAELDSLIIRHRHVGVSMIFALQQYKGAGTSLSKQLRNNLSCVLLYACKDKNQQKDFATSLAHLVSPEKLFEMWNIATSKPYQFLFVDYGAKPNLMFRVGFNKPFIIEDEKKSA